MQITYYLIAILIAAISVALIIFGNKKLALLGDEKTLAFDGAKFSFFTNNLSIGVIKYNPINIYKNHKW